jgi:serine protease Do
MIPLRSTFIFFIVLFSILNASYGLCGDLNKWTDKDGVAHIFLRQKNPIEYAVGCTFTIKGIENLGTGFFISSDGYAITCKHVIEDEPNQIAILTDLNEYPIGVIATSERHDLALILVATSRKTPFLSPLYPLNLSEGEPVLAIGSSIDLHSTVTDGTFSGIREKAATKDRVIQFSAPTNPGNSGGPLLDKNGFLAGVISWKLISNKGVPVDGIGFAVPSGYLIEEYGAYME